MHRGILMQKIFKYLVLSFSLVAILFVVKVEANNGSVSVAGEKIDINSTYNQNTLTAFKQYCTGNIEYSPQTTQSQLTLNGVTCDLSTNNINFISSTIDLNIILNGNNYIKGSGGKVLIKIGRAHV